MVSSSSLWSLLNLSMTPLYTERLDEILVSVHRENLKETIFSRLRLHQICQYNTQPYCEIQTDVELELVENMSLIEWLANKCKDFGATSEIITNNIQV